MSSCESNDEGSVSTVYRRCVVQMLCLTQAFSRVRSTIRCYTHHSDKLKQFDHRRVKEVVLVAILLECADHCIEKLALDDVTVVELILETQNSPQEAQSTCRKTCNVLSWLGHKPSQNCPGLLVWKIRQTESKLPRTQFLPSSKLSCRLVF